jgi:membrane protein
MKNKRKLANLVVRRPTRVLLRALLNFKRNQGLLLSGAVAYYTLLSIVPMLALFLVGLSHFVAEEKLYNIILTNLNLIIPGYAENLARQVQAFLQRRELVGFVGILVMLFFSSAAFTVLESAMAVIFSRQKKDQRRRFLISAIIPYSYIFLLGLGILVLTFISGFLDTLEKEHLVLLGLNLSLKGASKIGLYVLSMLSMILLLTSLYMVMPVGRINFRYALIGGVTATILWEITRQILVWYYSNLSLVNVIYGSLATAVVSLLSIEFAAIILLFGAQVIAEFEHLDLNPPGEEQSSSTS